MTMTPQSYPLWCAELDEDGTVRVGLVVGWTTDGLDPDNYFGYEQLPVVAYRGEHGAIVNVTTPNMTGDANDSKFFLSDRSGEAIQAAATYNSEVKRAARNAEVRAQQAASKES